MAPDREGQCISYGRVERKTVARRSKQGSFAKSVKEAIDLQMEDFATHMLNAPELAANPPPKP